MSSDATVTIRVPRDLKERIDAVAHDLQISQSAVWKILISHYLRPVTEGNLHEALETITIRGAQSTAQRWEPGSRPPAPKP